ncbi:MAG: hypothetical protein JSW61_04015 [Candidatus Thorarchaeota archaeon]|nr:MAG: hypothetical protein JSW61_04015 [Candidatus Thorarchaeota archaeon]
MSERLAELQEIRGVVAGNPKDTPLQTRKRFWKLVRQVKRSPKPDEDEIVLASEIRDMLFEAQRGRTYPTLTVVTMLSIVAVFPFVWYVRLLGIPLDWANMLAWSSSDWWLFTRRLLDVLLLVFLLYPFGRLIAGRWLGIKIEGFCRGMYNEPALKMNYESFLRLHVPRRKWFFFLGGAWTVITALALGVIGLLISGDWTGILVALFLGGSEGAAIVSGTTKKIGGEMAHFNRERKIERRWRRNLASNTESERD